ncbi:MAG TPA: TraR/DksA family transcriptional regulator [Terriglobales bacterium]
MKRAHSLVNPLPNNYRELLLAKKAELSSSLRSKLDTLTGPSGAALEDLAPVFTDQFTALLINRLDYLQLKLIEAALAQLNDEEYGVCVDCGNGIPGARLEAIPWAVRCINCQELSSSDIKSGLAPDSVQLEEVSAG